MKRFVLPVVLFVLADAGCRVEEGPLRFCDLSQRFAPRSSRLSTEGRVLRDVAGRQVLLRGINAGGRSKLPPFFPFEFLESGEPDQVAAPPFAVALRSFAEQLGSWGLNVVRLPWIWEALEPERGRIDEQYLGRYVEMAEALGARGMRVIVDFHQDVFARPYCGDGFPRWACPQPSGPRPADCTSWYSGYTANADVHRAFDRFWRNEDGIQDAFVAAWSLVAARTRPVDGVIGFDIMNEPHQGTADKAVWARETLRPFYERLTAVLQTTAPGALIFVEPTGLEGPITSTDLPRPQGEGIVLAPHYYHPLVFMNHKWSDAIDLLTPITSWDHQATAWGVPLLLGEYGMVRTGIGVTTYVRAQQEVLDRVAAHGTIWEASRSAVVWNSEGFNILEPDGGEGPGVEGLVRAFPRAVAGTLLSFSFEAQARTGSLEWQPSDGVTEIAAPSRIYPEGVTAVLEGANGCAVWDAARQVLIVVTQASASERVTFAPRR